MREPQLKVQSCGLLTEASFREDLICSGSVQLPHRLAQGYRSLSQEYEPGR